MRRCGHGRRVQMRSPRPKLSEYSQYGGNGVVEMMISIPSHVDVERSPILAKGARQIGVRYPWISM